ncbi:MAG TPA: copper chaperone PCu(A)C [Trebonia sp.]|nr:copper chaperone PCu(A)C [Trebonia sp.]
MIRRGLLAGAVAMLVVPALAGCEAGLNAPTLEFHPAAAGQTAAVDGIRINNLFVLAAPNGSSLPTGAQASLFMGLFNNNDTSDRLVSVETSASKSVTISGGSVSLPANQGVNLTGPQPDIVLNGLTQSLTGGQEIQVELDFAKAGPVDLEVPVEPQSFYYSTLAQPTATPTATVGATPTAATTPSQTPTASTNPKK